jgi:hypothetical protein
MGVPSEKFSRTLITRAVPAPGALRWCPRRSLYRHGSKPREAAPARRAQRRRQQQARAVQARHRRGLLRRRPQGTGGRGICRGGNRTCDDNAQWGACTGEVLPKKETCNRTDDDCDGIVDNNFERDGASCSIGGGSCKTSGTWRCNADGLGTTCDAPPPKTEPRSATASTTTATTRSTRTPRAAAARAQTGKPGVCAGGVMKCLGGTDAVRAEPASPRKRSATASTTTATTRSTTAASRPRRPRS